ncbi:hypothetical protein I4U23_025289 [Adineta vaga]|nr:hypothetical protein I4U23_025289 [Adineta vaga]
MPSIETLPVELLHRILDNLDIETISFSVRWTSTLFHSIVRTYNRLVFDFERAWQISNCNQF